MGTKEKGRVWKRRAGGSGLCTVGRRAPAWTLRTDTRLGLRESEVTSWFLTETRMVCRALESAIYASRPRAIHEFSPRLSQHVTSLPLTTNAT